MTLAELLAILSPAPICGQQFFQDETDSPEASTGDC